MHRFFDVTGMGCVSIDFLGRVPTWPEKGLKTPLDSFAIQGGGLVATALVTVARLGGRARFTGFLGTSSTATSARDNLLRSHVDTSLIMHRDGAEPIIAMVVTEAVKGERTIFFTKQNVYYPYPQDFSDLGWLENTRVFLFDSVSEQAGAAMAAEAKKLGITTIVDAERINSCTKETLHAADHIVVPESFAAEYTGKTEIKDMMLSLRSREEQVVVVTMGEGGASALWSDYHIHQPAFPVDAVDTTGAGDIFHGAYAYSISRGKDPFYACRYASGAAALSTLGHGGQSAIPDDKQVLELIKKQTPGS